MADLSVGIIGCGRIAQGVHLGILEQMKGVRVTALADTDALRRTQASDRVPHATAYADYRDLLRDDSVEAVVICLPTGLHADAAASAFEAGVHVYLEKPIATDAVGARQVLTAWRESGRVGMTGFNNRFHPVFNEARRHLAEGAIGEILALRSVVCSPTRELPDWKRARASGGGALLDLASHHADLLPHLIARTVRDVHASIRSVHTEDDNAALTLRFEGGVVAQLFVSLTSAQAGLVDVFGDAGRLQVDRRRGVVDVGPVRRNHSRRARLERAARRLVEAPADVWGTLRPAPDPSYRAAFTTFVEAARGGGVPAPDMDDGFRSLAIVLAAEESARTGAWISVNDR